MKLIRETPSPPTPSWAFVDEPTGSAGLLPPVDARVFDPAFPSRRPFKGNWGKGRGPSLLFTRNKILERSRRHPGLVETPTPRQRPCPPGDNLLFFFFFFFFSPFAAPWNSAVFSDAPSCNWPPGSAGPLELSTTFRHQTPNQRRTDSTHQTLNQWPGVRVV